MSITATPDSDRHLAARPRALDGRRSRSPTWPARSRASSARSRRSWPSRASGAPRGHGQGRERRRQGREPDAHLQSPDFFDAEQHPELRFTAEDIDLGAGEVSARGEITIKGVTRPVEVTGTRQRRRSSTPTATTGSGCGSPPSSTAPTFGVSWNNPLPSGEPALGERGPHRHRPAVREVGVAPMKILAISGSLRDASYNTMLLRAAGELVPDGVELELWDGLKAVPPFDEDDEVGEAPAGVAELRDAIAGADAILFATPEYNSSIPGVLKNAIDWASRPKATAPIRNKPVGRDRRQHGHVRRRLGAGRAAQGARERRRPRARRRAARARGAHALRRGRAGSSTTRSGERLAEIVQTLVGSRRALSLSRA